MITINKTELEKLDAERTAQLLRNYPKFEKVINTNQNLASDDSIEELKKHIVQFDKNYNWYDSTHWLNQIFGFEESALYTIIGNYCDENDIDESDLTAEQIEEISAEIQSILECNSKHLNDIISDIEIEELQSINEERIK